MKDHPGLSWLVVAVVALVMLAGNPRAVNAVPRPVTLHDLDIGFPGNTLSLSPDETVLAAENNGRLILMAYPSGRVIQELGDGILPRWSPSGDRLAFYSTRSGTTQLWIWARDGHVRQLTNFADGVNPDFYSRFMGYATDAQHYAWSPDGQRIVFASRTPVLRSGVSPNAPFVLTNVTDPDLTTAGICALPAFCATDVYLQGRQLVEEPMPQQKMLINQVFVANLATGVVTQITSPDRIFYNPIWTKDGSAVIAASIATEGKVGNIWAAFNGSIISKPDDQIVKIDPISRKVDVLIDNVGAARGLQLSDRGDTLYYTTSEGYFDHAHLAIGDLVRGAAHAASWMGAIEEMQTTVKSGQLAITYRQNGKTLFADMHPDDTLPSNIRHTDAVSDAWAEDRSGATVWIDEGDNVEYLSPYAKIPITIFRFRPADLELGAQATIAWKNKRGDELTGSLLYPLNYVAGHRYPLIVDAYPLAHAHGWMHSMGGNQTWAAAGYVVFMPGERAPHVWMNASNKAFGAAGKGPKGWNVALDDVLSGVDELAHRGIIDPNRMCLYGHSNGGGAVSYLVTMTHRFKCAVIAAPVMTDWTEWAIWTTGGREITNRGSGGFDFNRDINDFVKMSSVFSLYKARTPMLIVVGDDDDPLMDAIGVYNAVRDTGTPVTLVRYPGQGHVLTGAAMEDFWNRQMAFFAKYLGGTPPPPNAQKTP